MKHPRSAPPQALSLRSQRNSGSSSTSLHSTSTSNDPSTHFPVRTRYNRQFDTIHASWRVSTFHPATSIYVWTKKARASPSSTRNSGGTSSFAHHKAYQAQEMHSMPTRTDFTLASGNISSNRSTICTCRPRQWMISTRS